MNDPTLTLTVGLWTFQLVVAGFEPVPFAKNNLIVLQRPGFESARSKFLLDRIIFLLYYDYFIIKIKVIKTIL